jgi:hypothetical protein
MDTPSDFQPYFFSSLTYKKHDVKKKALSAGVSNAKSSRHAMQSRANASNTKVSARL